MKRPDSISVDNLPMGYLAIDVLKGARILKANKRMLECLGVPWSRIEGTRIETLQLSFLADASACSALYGQVRESVTDQTFEAGCPQRGKWFRIHPRVLEEGILELFALDITRDHQMIVHRNALIEGLVDIVFILDENFKIKEIITADEGKLFVPKADLLGKTMDQAVPEEYAEVIQRGMDHVLSHETGFSTQYPGTGPLRDRWFTMDLLPIVTPVSKEYVLSTRDITGDKLLEQELSRHKERYELAIAGSNDGIWDWDLLGNELYFSPQWKRQLGYEDHEISNAYESFEGLIHPEDLDKVREVAGAYLSAEIEAYDHVFRMVHKSGEIRWIRARGEALRDEKGLPYRMAGSHTDITEQQKTMEALEASEERLRQMAESIDDVFWLTDARTGKMLYVNPAYEKIWGLPAKNLYEREQSFVEAIVEEDLPRVMTRYRRYLEGEDFDMNYRIRSPQGSVCHIHAKSHPVYDETGVIIRHVGIARDITPLQRMAAEKAALYSEYEQVFNGTQDSMFLVELTADGELRYIRNNRSHQRNTGLDLEMIRGKTPRELVGEEQGSQIEANYRACVEKKEPMSYEETLEISGEKKTWLTTLTPILEANEISYIVGSSKDITTEKQARDSLATERMFLEETLKSAGDGVLISDQSGRIIFVNPVVCLMSGWPCDQLLGRKVLKYFASDRLDTSRPWSDLVEDLRQSTGVKFEDETYLRHARGQMIPIEASVSPIFTREEISGIVVVFRDMTQKNEEKRRILDMGYRDELTGLRNRRSYEAEFKRLDTPEHYPLALVMADLNGLKIINDAFGHTLGDRQIVEAARAIESSCRKDEIICRIGGDEFIILLPATSEEEAWQLVRRIRGKAQEVRIHAMELSISFGVAVKEEASTAMSQVFNQAEERMYREKLLHGKDYRRRIIDHIKMTLNASIKEREEHTHYLYEYSLELAKRLDLDQSVLDRLKKVIPVHDIGKITKINAGGSLALDDQEWCMTEREAETGYRILKAVNEYHDVAEIIYEHRECFDGSGTPLGRKGEEISIEARIIALVDYCDRMKRVNRLSDEAVLKAITAGGLGGRRFDPRLVEIFFKQDQ